MNGRVCIGTVQKMVTVSSTENENRLACSSYTVSYNENAIHTYVFTHPSFREKEGTLYTVHEVAQSLTRVSRPLTIPLPRWKEGPRGHVHEHRLLQIVQAQSLQYFVAGQALCQLLPTPILEKARGPFS